MNPLLSALGRHCAAPAVVKHTSRFTKGQRASKRGDGRVRYRLAECVRHIYACRARKLATYLANAGCPCRLDGRVVTRRFPRKSPFPDVHEQTALPALSSYGPGSCF